MKMFTLEIKDKYQKQKKKMYQSSFQIKTK